MASTPFLLAPTVESVKCKMHVLRPHRFVFLTFSGVFSSAVELSQWFPSAFSSYIVTCKLQTISDLLANSDC